MASADEVCAISRPRGATNDTSGGAEARPAPASAAEAVAAWTVQETTAR